MGELFVKATPEGLHNLSTLIEKNKSDRIIKELSCVETIEPITPAFRRSGFESPDILRRSPRGEDGFITRVRLFNLGATNDQFKLVEDFQKTCRRYGIHIRQKGYRLARGDRVPYAIIDRYGEIHSLPRQIEGVRTKDIRKRLAAYPPDSLLDATVLKEQIAAALQAARAKESFNSHAATAQAVLASAHEKRRSAFHRRLSLMKEKHRAERNALITSQKNEWQLARTARPLSFLDRLLAWLPGTSTLRARRSRQADLMLMRHYRHERHVLAARQRAAFDDIKRQARALARVEKRELRSLNTSLRREFLRVHLDGTFAAAAAGALPSNILASPSPASVACSPARRQPAEGTLTATFPGKADQPNIPLSLRKAFLLAATDVHRPVLPQPQPPS